MLICKKELYFRETLNEDQDEELNEKYEVKLSEEQNEFDKPDKNEIRDILKTER